MASKDRTGNKYEEILATSLRQLNYVLNTNLGKNYLHPSKKDRQIAIPGTYIQPDLVVREGEVISAIIYVTHWSKPRNSAFKFWRTWEESAQQKVILGAGVLSINCVFEALPLGDEPRICFTSDDLPKDVARDSQVPISFHGWYPATSWAMLEAFDVSIIFPLSYEAVFLGRSIVRSHDVKTTELLKTALSVSAKTHLSIQWRTLQKIKENKQYISDELSETSSRYRIGLLHLYLLHEVFNKLNLKVDLSKLTNLLISLNDNQLNLDQVKDTISFNLNFKQLVEVFVLLSQVNIRIGKKPKTLLSLKFSSDNNKTEEITRLEFNDDLKFCLKDLKKHISDEKFLKSINRSFYRFSQIMDGVDEAFDDLSSLSIVTKKEAFFRQHFSHFLDDVDRLKQLLDAYSKVTNVERLAISSHCQNWILELVFYLAGVDIAEDIYTHVTTAFENKGHRLRPHAPFGGDTMLVRYLLQGRDICEHWSEKSTRRTLTSHEFYETSWEAISSCIVQAFQAKNRQVRSSNEVIRRYLENKVMRVLGSSANGFHVMIEHYLSDICFLHFTEDKEDSKEQLKVRVCPSWQTEVIGKLWGGRPLETWMEGVSHNGQWLIKVQSSQDGNEGHKTKELAGRCRALRLAWSHGADPRDRSQWSFSQRPLPKLALVLDGDWDANKKRNLYEAGWDWVGDVSQLHELRQLIQARSPS